MNAANRRIALNTLLAIPVGLLGGAIAGELIGELHFVASVISGNQPPDPNWLFSLYDSLQEAVVGAAIGAVCFPIGYAAVARVRNVLAIVPVALLATVLSFFVGAAILDGFISVIQIRGPAVVWLLFVLVFAFPVASMFCACAWAAARERRKTSR